MNSLENIIIKREFIGNENVNTENVFHIAFGIDCNFTLGMGVLITSILLNNREKKFCFHVFTDNMEAEDIRKMYQLANIYDNITIKIHFLDKDKLKALPVSFSWTYAIYYRFIICEELYTFVDRVLYLDSDILCVNSIDFLADFDFQDYTVAAIEDISDIKEHADRLFNGEEVKYFSSGVLYININKWREKNITKKAIELLLKNNYYKFFDQDVLNQLLRDNVIFLDKKYNYIYNLYGMHHNIPRDTVFLHFAGTTKPWQRWAQSHPYVKTYMEYKNNSLWVDTPIMEATTYKQAKFMARVYKKNKQYAKAIEWYFKYSIQRIREKTFK